MSNDPSARRVLITGCSTGIGRALAVECTRRGYEVIATARRPEAIADLDVSQRVQLDVTAPSSIAAALEQAGRVDVLVNNSGFTIWGAVEAVPVADMQSLFETNLFGALRLIQAILPQMRERRSGIILQISSSAARRANPLLGHYAASKAALEMYSEALRLEVDRFGIGVAVVVLGGVATAFDDNRRDIEAPAYADLAKRARVQIAARRTEPARAEAVATRIADAMDETRDLPFRIYATDDAAGLVTARTALDDQAWQEQVLSRLYPGR